VVIALAMLAAMLTSVAAQAADDWQQPEGYSPHWASGRGDCDGWEVRNNYDTFVGTNQAEIRTLTIRVSNSVTTYNVAPAPDIETALAPGSTAFVADDSDATSRTFYWGSNASADGNPVAGTSQVLPLTRDLSECGEESTTTTIAEEESTTTLPEEQETTATTIVEEESTTTLPEEQETTATTIVEEESTTTQPDDDDDQAGLQVKGGGFELEFETKVDTKLTFEPLDHVETDNEGDLEMVDFDKTSEKGGTVVEGSLIYTPPAGFVGTDTFAFTVTDGTQSAVIEVIVDVVAVGELPFTGGDMLTLAVLGLITLTVGVGGVLATRRSES